MKAIIVYYSPPFFLSVAHELVHDRSQELLDRLISIIIKLRKGYFPEVRIYNYGLHEKGIAVLFY
jgi:hypothetical protein